MSVWEPRDDDGDRYLTVHLKEIPQVCGWGRTKSEALEHLMSALRDYVDWRLDEGLPIPGSEQPYVEPRSVLQVSLKRPAIYEVPEERDEFADAVTGSTPATDAFEGEVDLLEEALA